MTSELVLPLTLIALISYLIGAIPFGLLLGFVKGVDIREGGSGNIGATNAARLLGKPFFFLVLTLDLAKGLGPVLAAPWAWSQFSSISFDHSALVAGVAAILGHVFPLYLRFKGGKGVATSAGVFLGLCPWALLVGLVVWLAVGAISGYMSLASLSAAGAINIAFVAIYPDPLGANLPIALACLAVGSLVFFRHRSNIGRLWRGEEPTSSVFRKNAEKPDKQ